MRWGPWQRVERSEIVVYASPKLPEPPTEGAEVLNLLVQTLETAGSSAGLVGRMEKQAMLGQC